MSKYCLYVHITPDNKYYIGITSQKPSNRWKNGYGYGGSPYFYNAILKYGWDNIKHIVLLAGLSKDVACECEKYLIHKYNTNIKGFGYNICDGGGGTHGYHVTEARKRELRGRHISDVQKAAISSTLKKRWADGAFVNTGNNLRGKPAWNKGLDKSDPRVAKYARRCGEFHHSDSSKLKISLSHKGKPAHNRKRVLCVESGVVYDSVSQAQSITSINNISVAARSSRTAGGFHWRYIDDNI